MREDGAELPDERVRRALGRLAADADSAPEVPAAVTARIGAALRSAPPAHTSAPLRPRTIAVVVGVCAVIVAAVIGIAALLRPAPAPRFPTGPTAEKMTVPSPPSDTPKPVVTGP